MRSPRALLWAATALLASGLPAGCEDSGGRKPHSMQTVLLLPDKPSAPVVLEPVAGLTVSLPTPPDGSDYMWEIVSNNVKVLMELSPLRRDPPVVGAKATTSMAFYAAHPGHSVLRFVLVHPHDTDAIPASKCTLAVTVKDLD